MAYFSQPATPRAGNVTPYTAGDVVGGVITFPGAGPDNGVALLTSADLQVAITAIPTGMTSFRLHLYRATPPSALADNAVWTWTAADRVLYAGFVDIGSPALFSTGLYAQTDGLQKGIRMYGQTLYGYLVTNGGFTPAANSEVYTPSLTLVDL